MEIQYLAGFITHTLLVGGLGAIIATYLSKRLLTQLLDKEMIQFKEQLRVEYDVLLIKRKEGREIESEKLHELWTVCLKLTEYCKTRTAKNIIHSELDGLVRGVDDYLRETKVYLSSATCDLVKNIADLCDPENFSHKDINQLIELEQDFIRIFREHLEIGR